MEAIHPRAAKPLEMAGIPIRVKNAFEPDHAGTRITRAYVAASERVDVIAGTESVVTVEVCDTLMVGEAGFDRRIMEAISPLSVSYISKSTNANTISFVVLEADATDELLSRIKAVQADARFIPCSIVCVIGTNLGGGRILGRAAMALTEAAVPVLAVSQATRPVNIQFVIGRDHYATAVRAIHRAVIEQ
jgi:aspartate kinase